MSPGPSRTIEQTAERIREWVALAGRGTGPKPMAYLHVSAGDPLALARITLGAIREGIVGESIALARLALIVGAVAEHEARGRSGCPGWGTEAQVRAGLALIDCAMRATGWFALVADQGVGLGLAGRLGPRLRLEVTPGAMDAARHCLGREASNRERCRPTIRNLAPPYRTIRTLIGGKSVQVALAEAVGDFAGGGAEPGGARPLARA